MEKNFGLFSVSDDNKYVAIEGGSDDKNIAISVLTNSGTKFAQYTWKDVGFHVPVGGDDDGVAVSGWFKHMLYLSSTGVEVAPDRLITIDVDTRKIDMFSLENATLGGEFNPSPYSKFIAYTDHPWLGDTEGYDLWVNNNDVNTVHLYVYNLTSRKETTIATSHGKDFKMTWVNSNTIEYNDPITGARVQKKVN